MSTDRRSGQAGRGSRFYDEPTVAWSLRTVGPHLHPGGEEATVLLAQRADAHGFAPTKRVLDLGSGPGAGSRFLVRRYRAPVVSVDAELALQRMGQRGARDESLRDACEQILSLGERLPLADDSFDAAWSQDALGHMDKPAAFNELARVLREGSLFAFSDWVALRDLSDDERLRLHEAWSFDAVLGLADYRALLVEHGFEPLLVEDTTALIGGHTSGTLPGQGAWEASFAARYGGDELVRQESRSRAWVELLRAGTTGYGMIVARRGPKP